MPWKGCVLDLDGTTLDDRDIISKENLEAIELLRRKGLFITIATGRSHLMTREYVEQLGVSKPIISCNGAVVRAMEPGQPPLYTRLIDRDRVVELLRWRREQGIDAMVYTPERVYYPRGGQHAQKFFAYNSKCDPRFRVEMVQIDEDDYTPFADDVAKILLAHCDEDRQRQAAERFNRDGALYMVSSMSGYLDIMTSGVSKGDALVLLASRIGVSPKELIVFGDNHNDVPMFRAAGMRIAMGNAEDDVKREADFVTRSNNESGIAYAITNFVLQRL